MYSLTMLSLVLRGVRLLLLSIEQSNSRVPVVFFGYVLTKSELTAPNCNAEILGLIGLTSIERLSICNGDRLVA